MKVKIIADNLSEQDAFDLETYTIMDYVFNKGYSIRIKGYKNEEAEHYLTNLSFGGEGFHHDDDWCEKHSEQMIGENNPMYGVNLWESYSEEKKEEIKRKLSESFSGENNPMYGISPKDRMSDKKYKEWKNKQVERLSKQIGDKNPNYGNDTLRKKYEQRPELKILNSRPGSQNGRAKKVFLYDENMNFIQEFDYIGACCEYLKEKLNLKTKIDTMRSNISNAIKENKKYRNYYFFNEKQ